jgi:hypothetical protein
MAEQDPIPIMLRFYESRRTNTSTTFIIEPEPLKQLVDKGSLRTGFWLYALVKPGTIVKATLRLRDGSIREKTIIVNGPMLITRDGYPLTLSHSSGVFKPLFKEVGEEWHG